MFKKLKGLLIAAAVLALVGIVLFSGAVSKNAALTVTSDPAGEKIYLDESEVGETPYYSDELKEGDPVLRFGNFTSKIRLTPGALTVVNWALGPTDLFSAGETAWFSRSSMGSEILVISKPAASVYLNGELLGDSPLSKPLDPGEYDLELKKDGYFPRIIQIAVKDGYRLNISANLALNPFSSQKTAISSPNENLKIWGLSNGQSAVLSSDYSSWVKGAVFWAERDEDETTYDFYLTADGKLYDNQGSQVSLDSLSQTSQAYTMGYLGTGASLTSSAASTLNSFVARVYPTPPQVQILETGLGYLRVRSGPGKNYSEIGRANVGAKYTYLGEQSGWYKIDFNEQEGWVFADFAQKL